MLFQNTNPVHWRSTLMCVSPDLIKDYPGKIMKAIYDETLFNLNLFIKRDLDNLEQSINFTYYPGECYVDKKPAPKDLPESIEKLCHDFNLDSVNEISKLVGMPVEGLYQGNYLVGLGKR